MDKLEELLAGEVKKKNISFYAFGLWPVNLTKCSPVDIRAQNLNDVFGVIYNASV